MKARSGNLIKRGKVWSVRWMVNGKVYTRTTGETDKEKARTAANSILEPFAVGNEVTVLENVVTKLTGRKAELVRLESEQNPPPPLAHIWHRFLESPERPDSGDSTLRGYGFRWKRFLAWLGRERQDVMHLHEITLADAAAYAKELTAAKVSASTFNQHRNLLRMVWRVMADECKLTGNPWDKITPKKLTPLATRKRALTPAQFDSLLAAVEGDRDLKDLFTVLAWTGLRLADAVLMNWGAVDFSKRVISLAPMKTARRQGKIVHIPIFPAVMQILNDRQQGRVLNPKGFVFQELAAQYERDASAISKAISAAFDRAGMETTEERADREKAVVVFGAHSLRHFFVTAATGAGMPDAMIKSITGHGGDGMLTHYQQLGIDLASDLAGRISGGSAGMLAKTLPPASDAASERTDALRVRILDLAEQLTVDNVEEIRTLLKQAAV